MKSQSEIVRNPRSLFIVRAVKRCAKNFKRSCDARLKKTERAASLNYEHCAHLSKALVGNAMHHHQVLCAPEWPIAFSVFYDAPRERVAYAGQPFELLCRSRVEIDARGVAGSKNCGRLRPLSLREMRGS